MLGSPSLLVILEDTRIEQGLICLSALYRTQAYSKYYLTEDGGRAMTLTLKERAREVLFHYLTILFGIIDIFLLWSTIYIFLYLPYDTYLKWDSVIITVLSYYPSLRMAIKMEKDFTEICLRWMQAIFFFGMTLKVLNNIGKDADHFDITFFWK